MFDGIIREEIVALATTPYPGDRETPGKLDKRFHIALNYQRTNMRNSTEGRTQGAMPDGMSGGAFWILKDGRLSESSWTPEDTRVAAIGHTWDEQKGVLLGTRAEHILNLIGISLPDLKDPIRITFPGFKFGAPPRIHEF